MLASEELLVSVLCEETLASAIIDANAAYETQRARIQQLARVGGSKESLVVEHDHLKKLKRRHAHLVQALHEYESVPKTIGRGVRFYPPYMVLPRDVEDPDFVQSFDVADVNGSKSFLSEYGFVVFRDVLSATECERTRNEIWSYLEDHVHGFERAAPNTWNTLSETDTGLYYDAYGLPPEQSMYAEQLLRNRQNPRVVSAFQSVLEEDILMSHDRWCFYRSTESSKPTRMNLHLDLNPWRYMDGNTRIEDLRYHDPRDFPAEIPRARAKDGPNVQGVLNLADNREADGGTQLVPGFHRVFSDWQQDLGKEADWLYKPGSQANWLHCTSDGSSFKFHESDPIYERAHRVPMRQGCLLIWDQRLIHGACPNNSSHVRMAQFIRAIRRAPINRERAQARAQAVLAKIDAAGLRSQVSPLGACVFGLHDILGPCEIAPSA